MCKALWYYANLVSGLHAFARTLHNNKHICRLTTNTRTTLLHVSLATCHFRRAFSTA